MSVTSQFAFPVVALCFVLSGCVSRGEHDQLCGAHEAQSSALTACSGAFGQCQAAGEALAAQQSKRASDRLEREKQVEAVNAQLEKARRRVSMLEQQRENGQRTQAQQQARIRLLESLIGKHAKVVQRIAVRDVGTGRIAGLKPASAPAGKLAPHLSPVHGDPHTLKLNPDAIVELAGHKVQRFVAYSKKGLVSGIEMEVWDEGAGPVAKINKLMTDLCRFSKDSVHWMGRPGPGTPRPGGPPLVVSMRASCSFKAAPWSVRVTGRRSQDGADLNNINVTVSLNKATR